jgi:hypothetical protein
LLFEEKAALVRQSFGAVSLGALSQVQRANQCSPSRSSRYGSKRRVSESRNPSGIIDRALRQFRPRSAEWKGSDLIDTHMACLAPYCDITFVDERTHEGLQIARKKVNDLDAILRRAEKAKNTRVVVQQLLKR